MGGVAGDFEDAPVNNTFGVVTGTASAVIFPDNEILLVRFKASPLNTIPVFLGSQGVANFPLDVGEDTGWIPANNLSDFYYRGTGSYLHFWYQS